MRPLRETEWGAAAPPSGIQNRNWAEGNRLLAGLQFQCRFYDSGAISRLRGRCMAVHGAH